MWRHTTNPASYNGVGYDFQPHVAFNQHPLRNVALVGHSFVERLDTDRQIHGGDIVFTRCGHRGATIHSIRDTPAWTRLHSFTPDLTLLILGGNDIGHGVSPRKIAEDLVSLAKEIEATTGAPCHIIGIEKRHNPRGPSYLEYNKIRNSINDRLKRKDRWARLRYHSMCVRNEDISFDGVHLHSRGQGKLVELLVSVAHSVLPPQ